jgi:hypothetical protein
MAMAENAAAIRRVHLDRLGESRQLEGRPGKKIRQDRLQMVVGEPSARYE